MKFLKLFTVLAVSAVAANAFAAAKATIKIQADGTAFYDEISIKEDASAPANMDDNNKIGPKTGATSPVTVSVWAEQNSKKYATAILPSLNNLVIKFKANQANTAYTLTLSDVEGGLKLFRGAQEVTSPYAITCAVNEEITFTVSAPTAYTRDQLTAGDWGTICLPWSSTALEGATFYEALGTKNDKGIALAEVSALEAGKPYVFNATATEIKVTYDKATEVTAEVAGNKCTGSFAGCNVPEGQYIIFENLLYKAGTGCTIGTNRAYFDVETMGAYTPAPGRKVIFFGGKATPTSLEAAEAPAMMEGKMIINGKLVIIRDGKMFNAQGAQL